MIPNELMNKRYKLWMTAILRSKTALIITGLMFCQLTFAQEYGYVDYQKVLASHYSELGCIDARFEGDDETGEMVVKNPEEMEVISEYYVTQLLADGSNKELVGDAKRVKHTFRPSLSNVSQNHDPYTLFENAGIFRMSVLGKHVNTEGETKIESKAFEFKIVIEEGAGFDIDEDGRIIEREKEFEFTGLGQYLLNYNGVFDEPLDFYNGINLRYREGVELGESYNKEENKLDLLYYSFEPIKASQEDGKVSYFHIDMKETYDLNVSPSLNPVETSYGLSVINPYKAWYLQNKGTTPEEAQKAYQKLESLTQGDLDKAMVQGVLNPELVAALRISDKSERREEIKRIHSQRLKYYDFYKSASAKSLWKVTKGLPEDRVRCGN